MTDLVPVRRALISLSDKSGLDALAAGLARHGVEIVSTGGTAAKLRELGAEVRDISAISPAFPEMMDGRVKTLHPKVHGGLLGVRDNPEHVAAMEEHGIAPIDLVVVNLYPFLKTVMSGADRDTIIENIDIGGPSMVRSAAKNHAHVAIVTDPADYAALLAELDANGGNTTLALRKKLAAKAFALTAAYDSTISQWFAFADQGERLPETWTFASRSSRCRFATAKTRTSRRRFICRSARPRAASPRPSRSRARSSATTISMTPMPRWSWSANSATATPTVVIVKHANPCGVATRDTLLDAWKEALACDSVSAFGGIVAVNRPLDAATAEAISEIFTEVVVAPDADDDAQRDLRQQEEPAPAAHRRAARPGARRADPRGDRRRPPGPGPRQRHGHARPAQDASPSASRPSRNSPTACSPGPSPSTSSRTRSSMPRTASPPASARAR